MFHFSDQRPGEEVFMVIRKHPFVYLKIVILLILVILLPIVLFLNLWLRAYPLTLHYRLGMTALLFSSVYFLYGILICCIAWVDNELDLFIVTNERLIDITQTSLFGRNVASTPLHQIQDVTSRVQGIFPTLFNYGDIEVQTAAGDASQFFMDRISDPSKVAQQILNWVHEKKAAQKPVT